MKLVIKFTFLFMLSALSFNATAQYKCGQVFDQAKIAFGNGEELSYNVKYSASSFSTSVADVHFKTESEGDSFKITAIGKTRPFFSTFFDMEDQYQSWVNKQTLRPIRVTSRIKEGGYRYRSTFDYDWANKTAKTFGQNIKSGNTYYKTIKLSNCSYDALALFYNMRSVDMSGMRVGIAYKLELLLEDTIRMIHYKILSREVISVDGIGKFKTIKVSCQIATQNDDALKDGTEFYIWLTDDVNRIPVYMESPIRVGSIKVFLSNYKNLKHPLISVIR